MGANQLARSEEGRKAISTRIDPLAKPVKITLGFRGRNVILDKKFGVPHVWSG
jgi:chaperonin GroEL